MSSRVQHIDIAKGISIFLIAMFHSPLRDFYPEVIDSMSLFRMPLFFLLSGIFFSWQSDLLPFLIKKSEALLKPYFAVLLTLLVISAIIGEADLLWQLKGIFYGTGDMIEWKPLWFLTHLFAVYVFAFCLFKYGKFAKLTTWAKTMVVGLFFITGALFIKQFWQVELTALGSSTKIPGLPFSLDIILLSTAYFICGSLLRDKLIHFQGSWPLFISAIILFLLIAIYSNAFTDFNKRVYDDPIFATAGAFCGIYMVLFISSLLTKSSQLSYIPLKLGESSIFILIFHNEIQDISYEFFQTFRSGDEYLLAMAIAAFLISLVTPLFIKKLVQSSSILSLAFFPFKSNKLVQRVLFRRDNS